MLVNINKHYNKFKNKLNNKFKLNDVGLIRKIGKKRVHHQFVNTYSLSLDQRLVLVQILGE